VLLAAGLHTGLLACIAAASCVHSVYINLHPKLALCYAACSDEDEEEQQEGMPEVPSSESESEQEDAAERVEEDEEEVRPCWAATGRG